MVDLHHRMCFCRAPPDYSTNLAFAWMAGLEPANLLFWRQTLYQLSYTHVYLYRYVESNHVVFRMKEPFYH